ncbi:hypothetical protein LINPERPRIM_LOCUS41670 [Linum perenne]
MPCFRLALSFLPSFTLIHNMINSHIPFITFFALCFILSPQGLHISCVLCIQ